MAVLEKIRWECFCDGSYFDLWAVRPAGENRWGHCFHVQTKEEAEGLCNLLNTGYDFHFAPARGVNCLEQEMHHE